MLKFSSINQNQNHSFFKLCLALMLMLVSFLGSALAITVRDANSVFTIEKEAKRVIVLDHSFTSVFVELGLTPIGIANDMVAGETYTAHYGNHATFTSVGLRVNPDLKLIKSLQPDLIIADQELHRPIIADLKSIAPTLVLNSSTALINDHIYNFDVIAKLVGKQEASEKILNNFRQDLTAYAKRINANKQKAMYVAVTPYGLVTFNDKSYVGSNLEAMNFVTYRKPTDDIKGTDLGDLDSIVKFNPDFLFVSSFQGKEYFDKLASQPAYKKINAVKNNRVYFVDPSKWGYNYGTYSINLMIQDLIKTISAKR